MRRENKSNKQEMENEEEEERTIENGARNKEKGEEGNTEERE